MVQVIALGTLVGGLITVGALWFKRRRDLRMREQIAARVLYDEMTAASNALDMLLRSNDLGDLRWLSSLSESITLNEAWQEHCGTLGLQPNSEHWHVINDAVGAVAPSYGFVSVSLCDSRLRRRALVQRRERVADACGILRILTDCPRRSRNTELNWIADGRRRKWEVREDLREARPAAEA